MQLCRIMYYSLAAVHVSSDIFAHHQEHLNCIKAFGITHVMCVNVYCTVLVPPVVNPIALDTPDDLTFTFPWIII
jgi:hypothetical protein